MIKSNRGKIILKKIAVQLIYLGLILSLKIYELLTHHNIFSEILAFLTKSFSENGFIIVSIASFLENIVFVNVYFPGSVVILTTMGLTSGQPIKAIVTFCCIFIPVLLAQSINFYVGKHLMQRDEDPKNNRKLAMLFFLTAWHPFFAATTSIRLGRLQISYWKFISHFIPISFLWNLFWGLLMYELGGIKSTGGYFGYIFISYILIWMVSDIVKALKQIKQHNSQSVPT